MEKIIIGRAKVDIKTGEDVFLEIEPSSGGVRCQQLEFVVQPKHVAAAFQREWKSVSYVLFPFGKYVGESLADIPKEYYVFLFKQDWFKEAKWAGLRENIEKELAIRKQYNLQY